MRNLLVSLAVALLFLTPAYIQENGTAYSQVVNNAYVQENAARVCADVPGQTSGTRRFLRVGETLQISLRGTREEGVPASADCEPVELYLRWANGRNIGSLLSMTFFDSYNRPIYTKTFSAFLTGNLQVDLATIEPRPVYGASMMVMSVPASVTIQAAQPFAPPVNLSYQITRIAKAREKGEEGNGEPETGAGSTGSAGSPRGQPAGGARRQEGNGESNESNGNQVVSIREVVRLIGASKLSVVQIELKTEHPFPIKDAPLQLRIGKRVFVEELSGDHTGRRLTLSLTPEMFAELHDGDEIVASFAKREERGSSDQDVWNFGKLVKKSGSQ